MKGSGSIVSIRLLLAMLGSLALGLALGPVVAMAVPQGAARAPGITTIDLTRHTSAVVEGAVGARGSLSVACPTGTVIGGGFSHVGRDLRIIESRPHGIHAWRVSWMQTSADDTVVHAYAICMTTTG